jgi:hypothetical protein
MCTFQPESNLWQFKQTLLRTNTFGGSSTEPLNEQEMLMQAELYIEKEKLESTIEKKKKEIFEKVVTTVNACFNLEL